MSVTDSQPAETEPGAASAAGTGRWFDPRWAPVVLVVVAILFNLWTLRAEVNPGQNLNDASIHESMVRWAESRIERGFVPLDGWYPYLSLGAARFHHYQSLPLILTAYASTVFGDSTFNWSLYLLLSLWPIAVYVGARLLELDRWPAAVAALLSPLLVSVPGLGYEWGSYVWRGSGTWTQLWGMWMLPLSWGLTWRAVARDRSLALAALALAFTIVVHLLTGYLAILSLAVWVLIGGRAELRRRLVRGALVGVGSLLAASWMLVPLVTGAGWTIEDEFSKGTYFYDSFGARRVLGWLVSGGIFDRGRLPIVTIVFGVGLLVAIARWRREEPMRAVLGVGALSLLLFFGRPTLGPLLDLLPGGSNLFLRRYIMGVHLAGLFLAGVGACWAGARLASWVRSRLARSRRTWPGLTWPAPAAWTIVALVGVVALAPAVSERTAYARQGAEWIAEQRVADATDGAQVAELVRKAKALGGGRVFAGMRNGGGPRYRVGQVPLYASLLNLDADGVGFTRPTWSLASGVEARFDPTDPAQYDLFGVRYVIFPFSWAAPPGGERIATAGRHVLYRMRQTSGYLDVVDTAGTIAADRTNLGARMASYLSSDLPARGIHPTIAFGGRAAAPPSSSTGAVSVTPAGQVLEESDGPADGVFQGVVRAERPAVVMLKSSFDPGWRALVDGVLTPTQMIAPGFVGVPVEVGEHEVLFFYEPVRSYPFWFAVGALALLGLYFGETRARRRTRDRHPASAQI